MIDKGCEECRRLFGEYRCALMECIKLDGKLQIARLTNDLPAMDKGSDALAAANQVRVRLRQAIHDHETNAHPAARLSTLPESPA